MSFAAWYSIYKNLPDAIVSVLCARDLKKGYASYNWPYRVNVKFFQHANVGKQFGYSYLNKLYGTYVAIKEEIVEQPLLVVDCDAMCLRSFEEDIVNILNEENISFASNGPLWFFRDKKLEDFVSAINNFKQFHDAANDKTSRSICEHMLGAAMGEPEFIPGLCNETRDPNITSFTHYSRGCGKFDKKTWNEDRLIPPFGLGDQLDELEMSASEKRVLNLWDKMAIVYDASK